MSDLLRLTGMYSGMDTETIVTQLVSAKSQKVTNLKNEQKKLEWKQDIWKDLNTKIHSLYSKTLSEMRLTGSYAKKTTKSSDTTKATVIASDSAVNGSQTLEINRLAKAGYLTGAELAQHSVTDDEGVTSMVDWTGEDKISDIAADLKGQTIKLTVGQGSEAKETEITITADMKISEFVTKLKEAGVNASFDEKNQRFFVSSKGTGLAKEFKLENVDGGNALASLGLDENASTDCTRIKAQDAEIVLNGATFTSDTNTFSVNGLTVNAHAITDEAITITTDTDYDGIYDMIKDFISEYNEIINEVQKRYNADSASKYQMLTDEEKESMTDDQVEKWEDTIKDSLLRRDGTLSTIMSTLTSTMNAGYYKHNLTDAQKKEMSQAEIDAWYKENGGEVMYLFDFGIERLNYFEAEEDERQAYHIAGDPDDEATSSEEDKLKSAIATDPEGTVEFFASLCKSLYNNLHTMMGTTDYSSIYKVYDDKRMQTEYDDYTKKIAEAEEELNDYEDRWYEKFSAMEVALSKLQSNQNVVASMLGQ